MLGTLAIGAVGLVLAGTFALVMQMVSGIDPIQMIAFAGSLAILGLTMAVLGNIGPNIMIGALAMSVIGPAPHLVLFEAITLLGAVNTISVNVSLTITSTHTPPLVCITNTMVLLFVNVSVCNVVLPIFNVSSLIIHV